ncbi:MAG: hypothetical protein ABIS21_06560 [Acidimicrobiales bacterium]
MVPTSRRWRQWVRVGVLGIWGTLRDAVPRAREALADRLDAFIASSTPTPAAAVVPIRPL